MNQVNEDVTLMSLLLEVTQEEREIDGRTILDILDDIYSEILSRAFTGWGEWKDYSGL